MFVVSVMNEKKYRANKQPPHPPTFIEWLAFSCIKHEENEKMSKGLASKVFIMVLPTTLQFHAGVFLRLHANFTYSLLWSLRMILWLRFRSSTTLMVNCQ